MQRICLTCRAPRVATLWRYFYSLNDELHERWCYCEDLAWQLAERTQRKQAAGLISDPDAFYKDQATGTRTGLEPEQ